MLYIDPIYPMGIPHCGYIPFIDMKSQRRTCGKEMGDEFFVVDVCFPKKMGELLLL